MQQHHIPVIELWGHVFVPLQGDISDSQMDHLQATVLERIRDRDTDGLILDASGVWLMDSHLCAALGDLASAARLMGARPVLCGLGPGVVMTLQTMGVELDGVETALNLEAALGRLGLRLVRARRDDDAWLAELAMDGADGRAERADADDETTGSDDEGQ